MVIVSTFDSTDSGNNNHSIIIGNHPGTDISLKKMVLFEMFVTFFKFCLLDQSRVRHQGKRPFLRCLFGSQLNCSIDSVLNE